MIFDRFKGQCTPRILFLLSSNNFLVAVVPGNCIDRLQPLDVSVNKSAKDFLRQKFQQWYADKISESLRNGETEPVVNLGMGVVKPLGAQWLQELYDYMLLHPEVIINGFRGAGI